MVVSGKLFKVSSEFVDCHEVNLQTPSCTCYDFAQVRWPCRHMLLLFIKGHAKWDDLPEGYRNMPYLILDPHVTPSLTDHPEIEVNKTYLQNPEITEPEEEDDEFLLENQI